MVATFFDRDGATDPAYLEGQAASLASGYSGPKEDNRICESVQRARRSPAVNSQFYSPFWDAMHYTLSNLILDKLEEGERIAAGLKQTALERGSHDAGKGSPTVCLLPARFTAIRQIR